jgi:hypothetical protein
MCECGRAYADLWLPRRSIGIRAERMVEAPASESRAQLRKERKALMIVMGVLLCVVPFVSRT